MKLAPALLMTVFFVLSCNADGTSKADNPPAEIIVASDLPISAAGISGQAALPAQQAIQFAIRQKPIVEGFRLGYMALDDSLAVNPSEVKGVQNVKRMIRNPIVLGMIGPFNSAIAFSEIMIANGSDLAMLSPSNTADCLTLTVPQCRPGRTPKDLRPSNVNNYFRIAAPNPPQGRAMARYTTRNLNLTRVAVLNEWGGLGQLMVKEFEDEIGLAGGQVVYRQDVRWDTHDFGDFLKRARAMQAQAVYALGYSGDGICAAAAQMRKVMPDARFLASDGVIGDPRCISDAADNSEGILATSSEVDPRGTSDPAAKKLVEAYLKTYPKPSDVSAYTFAAYDCARILIDAIGRAIRKNNGTRPTRLQVVRAIAETTDFVGVTGTYTFDKNGDALSPLMSVYEVRGGKWNSGEKIDVSAKQK